MIKQVTFPIVLAYVFSFTLGAQTLKQTKEPKVVSDEVQKAIDEFNRLKKEGKKKTNEVTVVLPPPVVDEDKKENTKPDAESPTEEKPVLVTGKPPTEASEIPQEKKDTISSEISDIEIPEINPANTESPSPNPSPKELGLQVRVESIRKGTGKLDPKKIKLRASFPAKPLASAPAGWVMQKLEDAPAVERDVEIEPGTVISLDITPHVLIPDADGSNTFAVSEPGFDSLSGYRQEQTVSAILAKSVVQLDEDSKQLGAALSELEQILSSLPKPEPKAVPVEEVEQ